MIIEHVYGLQDSAKHTDVYLDESALNLSNVNSGIETLTNVHDYVSLQHLRKLDKATHWVIRTLSNKIKQNTVKIRKIYVVPKLVLDVSALHLNNYCTRIINTEHFTAYDEYIWEYRKWLSMI